MVGWLLCLAGVGIGRLGEWERGTAEAGRWLALGGPLRTVDSGYRLGCGWRQGPMGTGGSRTNRQQIFSQIWRLELRPEREPIWKLKLRESQRAERE